MPRSLPYRQSDDVFHRHVAGALAETRDGRVRDGCAGLQRGNRVRDAETEILVAVNLDGLLQPIDHLAHDVRHRVGRAHAHRVGHRQRVHVAFGRDLLHDVEETTEFSSRRVDREEHRVEAGFFRGQRRVDRRLHRAIDTPAVRVLDHVVAGGNLDDDALAADFLGDFDFLGNAASEGEHFSLQAERGDVGDRGLVLRRHRRHAGLDAVDAEGIELFRDRHFFFAAKHHGRLLLAVAQCHVVDLDFGDECLVLPDFWQITPRAREPLVGFPGLIHAGPPLS